MKVRAKRNEIIAAVVVAALMLSVVSLAAGAQSFGHMQDWALLNHEPHWRALLFPVSVDGTILASTVVLYVDHRLDRPGTPLAYWLLGVGVAISVVANVFHTWTHDLAARGISAIGPLALFGIFHLFVQFIRSLVGVIPAKEPKPVVLEQEDLADEREPVDDVAPAAAPDGVPVVLHTARIGPVRRPKRTSRLAGRHRRHNTPQAPAAPAPTHVQLWDASASQQQWKEVLGEIVTPTAAPEPVPASAAAEQRPPRVTQQTGPRSRVARTSRSAKASPTKEQLEEAARGYWTSERAAGRGAPSARKIAEAVGGSKSSISRWMQNWPEGEAG